MEITIAVPQTNLFSGAGSRTDNKRKASDNSAKSPEKKDILELSAGACKALQNRESRQQTRYALYERKNTMKLEAAATLKKVFGKSGKDDKGGDNTVAKAGRAMKAAAALSTGKPVSREDLELLLELDPGMYFLAITASKSNEIIDDLGEYEADENKGENAEISEGSNEAPAKGSSADVMTGTEFSGTKGTVI